ncbi:MAG: aspartyl protease family protein [Aeoliella sp.]
MLVKTARTLFVAIAVSTLLQFPLTRAEEPSIGGFVPFLGMGMTDEFKTFDDIDLGPTFFISDAEPTLKGSATQFGTGGTAFYDIALLDTGAATHIITEQAYTGFDIDGFGFTGVNIQPVGGATGTIDMVINDAAGVYVSGLGDRTSAGSSLVMDSTALRGQSSFATLAAPSEWTLPNIVGLPMAMHHSIVINNDDPQVFELHGRTVRTPNIELVDVGSGDDQGIQRRAALNIRPGIGFVQGPFYVYNLDLGDILSGGGELALHDDPASPTVVQDQTGTGGSLFLNVDLERDGNVKEEREFLFDTGADLTVISQHMAKRLGFDAILDTPDFVLEVEGSGGVAGGVPGIYLDELNIVTVGGDFTMQNVPVAILDVTDVSDPGNVLDGIIGMHLFNGRNLVIDAKPSLGAGGVGPSLYISDPVTTGYIWTSASADATWHSGTRWSAGAVPDLLATTQVVNVSGADQIVRIMQDAESNTLSVAGTPTATTTLLIESGATLTTFGEAKVVEGGVLHVSANSKLDSQFVNIDAGVLTGSGEIFAGTGPLHSPVRNLAGRVEPGDGVGRLSIDGDFSNLVGATLAIELAGTIADTQHDQLDVSRFAFLSGTLEVSLADIGAGEFVPAVGNAFTILTAGDSVSGMFDNLLLPSGYSWDIAYNPMNVVLSVAALVEGLPGDFNSDNIVDAADYTVWRNGLGDAYTTADYALWKNNFGMTAPAASFTVNSAVPEPATAALLAMIVAGLAACRGVSAVLTNLRIHRPAHGTCSVR